MRTEMVPGGEDLNPILSPNTACLEAGEPGRGTGTKPKKVPFFPMPLKVHSYYAPPCEEENEVSLTRYL